MRAKIRLFFLKNKKIHVISLRNFMDSDFMLIFAALKLKTVLEERDLRDLHVGTKKYQPILALIMVYM